MKKVLTICAVAAIVLIWTASPTLATLYGTVDAKIGGGDYALNVSTMIQPYDSGWYTGYTGRFSFTYSNMTPPNMGLSSYGFCIEPQTISFGATYPYSVRDVFDAPIPDGPADTSGGPMGVLKAKSLKELWGRSYSQVNSNVTGAAFQLAVWEIVFEDLYVDSPPSWTVRTGMFKAQDPGSGDIHSAIVQADIWLGQINGQGPKADLLALTNSNAQDFLVPEPATIGILGFGALSLIRRKK
jgi:hypothetical protein